MTRIITLMALAAVFTLFAGFGGCGGMDKGTVIGKAYEPETVTTMWLPVQTSQICSGSGTSTSPRTCVPIYTNFPFTVTDGEDWKLRLKDGDREGWAYVSRATYEELSEGDYYIKDKHNGYVQDPNNREVQQ